MIQRFLPNNVASVIRHYVRGERISYMETSIYVPIYKRQRDLFHGMWSEMNGETYVQFDLFVTPNACKVTVTDEDGCIHEFENL